MAFLGWLCFGGNTCSVLQFIGLVDIAINHVGQSVAVDGIRTYYCHILCRHRFGHFAPAAEGIALLYRDFGFGDGGAKYHSFRSEDLTVQHVGQRVAVCCKRSGHSYIMHRHGLGHFAPATEGMTFLDRFILQHNNISERESHPLVLYTIHHVDEVVFQVLVDGVASRQSDVLCWHGLGHFAPTTEIVALFCRHFGCGNNRTISYLFNLEHFAIQDVGHFVYVCLIRTSNGHILCRHRFGHFTPAAEGMSLFLRHIGDRNLTAIGYFLGLVYCTVNHIGNNIMLRDKLSSNIHVCLCLKGIGIRC